MRTSPRMWPGKKAFPHAAIPKKRRSRRSSELDVARGVFVTRSLKVEEHGVEAWEDEARAQGARDDNATSQDPEHYYVEKVIAECRSNADRLTGEAHDRLNALRAPAREAIGVHLRANLLLREAIAARARRRRELDLIDPRVGRFGEGARICLLIFGFILEAVLIWLATYRIDLTNNQRLVAALIVGALITGVLHVIVRYLTQQIARKPSRLIMGLILAVTALLLTVVVILLTGLAEVRKTDFAVLQGNGVNIASFRGWLFWILLCISILGTMSATVAGVAHGVEAPLRDARRALKKAKREQDKRSKEEGAAQTRRQALVDQINDIDHVFVRALDSVPEIAVRVGNEYLAAQALGHTVEITYRDEKTALEAHTSQHAKSIREWHRAIDKDLAVRVEEVRTDLAAQLDLAELAREEREGRLDTVSAPDALPGPAGA